MVNRALFFVAYFVVLPFLIAQQAHQKLGSFPSNYFKAAHSLPHHAADLIAKPPLRALAAANNFDEDHEMNEEERNKEGKEVPA